jgi:hypothetical protein
VISRSTPSFNRGSTRAGGRVVGDVLDLPELADEAEDVPRQRVERRPVRGHRHVVARPPRRGGRAGPPDDDHLVCADRLPLLAGDPDGADAPARVQAVAAAVAQLGPETEALADRRGVADGDAAAAADAGVEAQRLRALHRHAERPEAPVDPRDPPPVGFPGERVDPLRVERGGAVVQDENGARHPLEPPGQVEAGGAVRGDEDRGADPERALGGGPAVLGASHGRPQEARDLRLDPGQGPVGAERLVAQVQDDGPGGGPRGRQGLLEQLGGAAARHQHPIDPPAAGPVDEGVDVVARQPREQGRTALEAQQALDALRVESERLVAAAQDDAPTDRGVRTTAGV